jgi:hypothetical protein
MPYKQSVIAVLVGSALTVSEVEYKRSHSPGGGDCFDAEVFAKIVDQVPTVALQFDDGSVVTHWPWMIDLEVKRTLSAASLAGKMTVISLQHTYYRSKLGSKRWHLRRNDQGRYNLLGLASEGIRTRCPDATPPAAAYIALSSDEIQRLREEGRKYYGR